MNTHSIRFRLSFWYSLTFFTGLILAFISFYILTRQVLLNQTDSSLTNHGNKVVEVVSQKSNDMHQILAQSAFLAEFSEIPGMLVTILDGKGNLVSSSMMCCYDRGIYNQLFQKTASTNESFIQNQVVSGENLRFFTSGVYSGKDLIGAVIVAHPIDIIQKSLNSILIILGIVAVLLLIPTIIGGFLLSKKAMQPISSISENLKFISGENLNQKVQNPKTGDELEKLADSFNLLLNRLDSAFKREKQLIGDIAHELKTPLSIIRGNIELTLSKSRSSKEYKKALKDSVIDVNSMSDTLNNILDLAWSEADAFKGNLKEFDFSLMLDELYEIAVKMAQAKHIAVNLNSDKNVKVTGFPEKLSRAILNIIDNSVKYSPQKTNIGITLRKKINSVELEITDQGQGIYKKDLPHLFERFYRGENVKNIQGGGLGLSITKAIISAHQGHLKIESRKNRGTKVLLSLPIS
ncbi:hypothetical protein A3D05_01935 [Candidatus Gottesmanbacteria bacterium RIFCSPHIGHO2_02_FULL_40_24]|nr:MAG: hypothetical protein A3D05_01935 [Candidatus Gottesmanbacteria bacterium RIFCSPHIGHO2_02_FULL_40_24]